MKRREVSLDFTSLLDVTLIVIFFFVLFSTFDAMENIKKVDDAVNRANIAEQEARELADEYITALEIVNSSTERNNKQEIVSFNKGMNLKIILDMSEEKDSNQHYIWSVRILNGDKMMGIIPGEGDLSIALQQFIEDAGYSKEDTILCDLIVETKAGGSNRAMGMLEDSLEKVKKEYKYFYVSQTDLSIGGE